MIEYNEDIEMINCFLFSVQEVSIIEIALTNHL